MSSFVLPAPATMTRNITRVYRAATTDQRTAGLAWYADANGIAESLSARFQVTPRAAAGILAALSPLNSWGANINLATRFIREGGLSGGYLGTGLRKAHLILNGAEPSAVLTSDKVGAFFECIVSAGQTDAVCIDRHAWAIAVNERGSDVRLSHGRYAATAAAYVRAAAALSASGPAVTPAQTQAVTWVAWRARYWAAGAWDQIAE